MASLVSGSATLTSTVPNPTLHVLPAGSMRRFCPSMFRYVALILVMTIFSAGMAMASYVCPTLTSAEMSAQMTEGMPCDGMDIEKPVHCAEFSADTQASLELHSSPLPLPPFSFGLLVLVIFPLKAPATVHHWAGSDWEPGPSPPYLRTIRIQV